MSELVWSHVAHMARLRLTMLVGIASLAAPADRQVLMGKLELARPGLATD